MDELNLQEPLPVEAGEPPVEPPAAPDLRSTLEREAAAADMATDYPDFDLDAALAEPTLGAWLRGERAPGLRALYEAAHLDDIVEARVSARLDAAVAAAVETAVTEAVVAAVAEHEARLLGHIRARGQRPAENGTAASPGIRVHPAVERLTRRERAALARRAERGETVHL